MGKIDVLSIVSALTGIVFAVFTDFSLSVRIIILLAFIILSLFLKLMEFKQQIDNLNSLIQQEKSKNTALARQYRGKKKRLDAMERYWIALHEVFLAALNGSARERFQYAYNQYITFSDHLESFKED